jgi:hypothetical protein
MDQMIDQMKFMHELIRPGHLEKQAAIYVHTRDLFGNDNDAALRLINEAITQGEFNRGAAETITGRSPSSARVILGKVLDQELLSSPSAKGAIRIGLPSKVLDTYFPALFPLLSN